MGNTPVLQVGVKILLENEQGQYLLLFRSAEKYPEITERWDIVGGRIKPGTPLLENLGRELKEETGLELIGEPRLVAAQDIFRKTDHHVVRLTYIGHARGEVNLDKEEHDDYRWFSREDLKNLEGLDRYVKQLLDTNILFA
jgi:ADP-ribose pyrophosphatase YjhB (NUDIX family)